MEAIPNDYCCKMLERTSQALNHLTHSIWLCSYKLNEICRNGKAGQTMNNKGTEQIPSQILEQH